MSRTPGTLCSRPEPARDAPRAADVGLQPASFWSGVLCGRRRRGRHAGRVIGVASDPALVVLTRPPTRRCAHSVRSPSLFQNARLSTGVATATKRRLGDRHITTPRSVRAGVPEPAICHSRHCSRCDGCLPRVRLKVSRATTDSLSQLLPDLVLLGLLGQSLPPNWLVWWRGMPRLAIGSIVILGGPTLGEPEAHGATARVPMPRHERDLQPQDVSETVTNYLDMTSPAGERRIERVLATTVTMRQSTERP